MRGTRNLVITVAVLALAVFAALLMLGRGTSVSMDDMLQPVFGTPREHYGVEHSTPSSVTVDRQGFIERVRDILQKEETSTQVDSTNITTP